MNDSLKSQLLPMFPQIIDIKTAYLLMKDYTKRHFPTIPYKRLITTNEELDDVHGEVPETAKRWSPVVHVRAFVVPEQVVQPLTRFGMEDQRDAEVYFSVGDLVEAGLATQNSQFEVRLAGSCIGDHFGYHGVEYEIRQFVPFARWGNTDLILYYAATASMYRSPSERVTGQI